MSKCSKKLLHIESFKKNISYIIKKTLSSSSFIRATKSPTKVCFFHLFPIFPLAFGLRPWGGRFGRPHLLWNHLLCPPPSRDMAERRRGSQLGPPGVLCLHPTPLWWSSPTLVQHRFVPRGPPATATAWKDIEIWRSRLNNASFQTPLRVARS